MVALPLELYRRIVELIVDDAHYYLLYRHHLLAVSQSCHLLRHEAQRILFRHPGKLHPTTASRRKPTLFLDTIISSPDRLALFVESFNISFDQSLHLHSDETAALLKKISSALKAMHNLKSINVSQRQARIRSLPSILQDVHFKLTSFSWSGPLDAASEALDVKANFLRHQDKIEHLEISSFIHESALKSIAADICPRLRSLSAPYSITAVILPGKQYVTSLRWIRPLGEHIEVLDPDVRKHLDSISKELGRIRYLSYDSFDCIIPIGPKIRRIAPFLTSLVCLDTRSDNIMEVEALAQLPCLQILILDGGAFHFWPAEEDIIKVAASCKSLKHIDIEDDYGDVQRFKYEHSSKTLQSHAVDEFDSYIWIDDFDIFDD